MQITIDMIESKEFKIKPRGYDQQEVDEFLDAICDEIAAQLDQIQSLQQQLMTAQAKRPAAVAAAPAAPASAGTQSAAAVQEILEMAQKLKAETLANAEKQAQEIVDEAHLKADEQLKSLQGEKDSLTRQVADLKTVAADYRARFEALLQAQQEAIEKATDLF